MTFRISPFDTFGPRWARTASIVITGLGLLAVACGPSSDDYTYTCDSTGCYRCDPYGCSRDSTVDAGPQTGDAATSVDASPDASAPDATTPPSDAGTCGTEGAGPCTCDAAKPCATGQVCTNGVCTDERNGCKYSSECADGKVCADSMCVTPCDGTCSDGFTCDKGVCKPSTPDCVTGDCAKTCTADGECGAGKYCNQGACVTDTRPTPNCTADSECGGSASTPKKCVRGFCKFTCDSDAYCRTIDSRIGTCAADKVCRTAAEATASCTASSDCTGGKACIDNACK